MKTAKTDAAAFALKFGSDKIREGNYEYFVTDIGIGVIKDINTNTIEVIESPDSDISKAMPHQEQLLMNMICGEYEERVDIPPTIESEDYYYSQNKKYSARFYVMWTTFGVVATILLIMYIYLFHTK